MPAPSGTILEKQVFVDNLITTTFYDVRKTIIDPVFQVIPFYDKMVEAGRIREKSPDGTHFEVPVRYAKQDQNIQYVTRGVEMGVAEKESLTRLFYTTSVIANSIVRVWDDERRNRGKAKLIDWVNELVENSTESLRDAIAEDYLFKTLQLQLLTHCLRYSLKTLQRVQLDDLIVLSILGYVIRQWILRVFRLVLAWFFVWKPCIIPVACYVVRD